MKQYPPAELDAASDLLSRLIAVPSVNPAGGAGEEISGEARLAAFIVKWAKAQGLKAKLVPVLPGRPCVLIKVPAARRDAPTIAYFAHLDTVWTPAMATPFKARRDGNQLAGLGACDDKGGIAVGLMAAAALAKGPPPPVNFVFCGTADEESGFTGVRKLVPGVLRPDAAIVAEPTGLDPVVAHKGVARWRVTVKGQSVHASLIPQGRSAIYPAARMIGAVERHLQELLRRPRHPRLGLPTINVGVVRGGTQDNSVPDHCEFSVERRLLPGESVAGAERELRGVLAAVGEGHDLCAGFQTAPFAIADDHPWPAALLREVRKLRPQAEFAVMTAATEAAHLGGLGIPAVVFGPGQIGMAHAVAESVPLDQVLAAREVVVSTICHYVRGAASGIGRARTPQRSRS